MPEWDNDEFPLAELMDALAEQLGIARKWAVEAAEGGEPSFISWTGAEIEVGITWTRSGSGGIDLKVLNLGGERTKENTATMTVTLAPTGGEPLEMVTRIGPR
jgi:Trypsin-co-occurring domain 2